MVSLEQIFDASLEDLQKITGPILTQKQIDFNKANSDQFRDKNLGAYRVRVIKNYYNNGMLDVSSDWIVSAFGNKFYDAVSAGWIKLREGVLTELNKYISY